MDNGEKERVVANNIKQIVKQTSRRKAGTQALGQGDVVRIAPRSLAGASDNSSSNSGPSSQSQDKSIEEPETLQNGSVLSSSPEHNEHATHASMLSISAEESVLVMHFLDVVFPLQYPMYKPGILEGGRGWLLALLFRTKPLYHAALALSSYHRRKIILTKITHPCQLASLVQVENHLEICLTEFQKTITAVTQYVTGSCPTNGLGVLTSMVQLVFFELFASKGNAWQIHLRAAVNAYDRLFKEDVAMCGLTERTHRIIHGNVPLSLDIGTESLQEVVLLRFLGGTIIWLDIISSITAGTAPHLLPFHSTTIASDSQTKLEDIMGCKNWVMLQIGRIAALHQHKVQALERDEFAMTEIMQAADNINQSLQCGLANGTLEGFHISEGDSAVYNAMSDPPTLVSLLFAYMASVYLHLVIHGFGKLEELDSTISAAINILQTQVPVQHLPALVAPFGIKLVQSHPLRAMGRRGMGLSEKLQAAYCPALPLNTARNYSSSYTYSRELYIEKTMLNIFQFAADTIRQATKIAFQLLTGTYIAAPISDSTLAPRTMKHIVILGGSIAGISTAHRLLKKASKAAPFKITLVSPNTHFYWNVASPRGLIPGEFDDEQLFQPIAAGFSQYPADQFEFITASAESVDVQAKKVTLSGSRSISYDILVLCTGCRTKEHTPFKGLESTEATKNALHELQMRVKAAKSIVVAGAGATGVEIAGELGYKYGTQKKVILISGGTAVLEGRPASMSKAAIKELQKLKVDVKLQTKIKGSATTSDGQQELTLMGGDKLVTDLYIPTFGEVPNSSYLPAKFVNTDGFVTVDEYLKLKGAEDVWAIGDVSDTEPPQFMFCDAQSVHAVKSILSTLTDKAILPYKVSTSSMIGLQIGKKAGVGHFGGMRIPGFIVTMIRKSLFVERLVTMGDGSEF
ncbi:hypothetical protein BP6252_07450 [Coleophoma cylindrospora]|uniref:FAD/NAD(P)-binding domain-containing protein n=1 Tax=Coleophoma cylindrospora TaxID=1849047 RepID=A0A3D8RHM5_9HELO|nr:hypothetical protein BP6252_07450 [Coleophoma cylindrospora]